MSEYSKYPNQIDTTTELPKATDGVTEVKAEVVNRARDAILAMQGELGVQPSGTYSTVRARLDAFAALIDDLANLFATVTGVDPDAVSSGGDGTPAKVRVFRATSDLAGAAAGVAQTVTWGGTSSLVSNVSAEVAATSISPTISGNYSINGQLTIAPTIDSISSVLIEVLVDGAVVHTVSDSGAVWGVGIQRSNNFAFQIDLDSGVLLSVRWTHSGSVSSTTELIFGDSKSWFSFSRISPITG